jgi:hypothetical protein
MMKSQQNGSLDSFDKESFKAGFENVIPRAVAEVSDMLERRPPHVPKRVRREMAEDMAWVIEASIPHVKTLEGISGDLGQIDKGYRTMEEMVRTWMRRTKTRVRLKPGEDLFDYFLRRYWTALRPPYRMKRLKQHGVVRGGIESLITAVLNSPGGIDAANQLIEEFQKKHLREYVRSKNALDARLNSYRHIDMGRMTHRNITRLTELYQGAAAAFENRLRLLVGLNHIARGKTKTYDDLRKLGYNELLQAVSSPDNPLLHFLQGSVDRNVRNAMMHAGVSSSLANGVVRFADRKKEVEWTMSEFIRRTKNLILTIMAVEYLEPLFNYARAYSTFAALRYLRANPPGASSDGGTVVSSPGKAASVSP